MKRTLGDKVTAQSLVDVVTERIETAIISGALQPGTRLSEQGLADSMGLSRGPLREAISRLEGRKLLERTPNIGVRVAALSLRDYVQMLQIREMLEGLACALAAENMTQAELAGMRTLLRQHEAQKSVREGKGYYPESKDFEFHFRIATASRNERLIHALNGDLQYLLRVYRHKLRPKPGRAIRALQEHKAIVEALVRRDPVAAEHAMRAHLRSARLNVEEQLAAEEAAVKAAPATTVRAAPRTRAGERVASLTPAALARRR